MTIVVILTLIVLFPFASVFELSASSEKLQTGNDENNNYRDNPGQVARFTLEVVDANTTKSMNQSIVLDNGNATENVGISNENISVTCSPLKVKLYEGKPASILCNLDNNSYRDIALMLECLGLEGTSILCTVNENEDADKISISSNSSESFDVGMLALNVQDSEVGKSYDFTIRVTCIESTGCY
jgi:hypothetical protein